MQIAIREQNGSVVFGSVKADVMCDMNEEDIQYLFAIWP